MITAAPGADRVAQRAVHATNSCASGALLKTDDDGRTWTVIPLRCKQWKCRLCAERLRAMWVRKLCLGRPDRHVTLTVDPANFPVLEDALHALRTGWSAFVSFWRRRGHQLEYARIVEIQPGTGMPHFHILVRGTFIPQRLLARFLEKRGVGRIHDVRKVRDTAQAAFYVSKYLSKATTTTAQNLPGQRLIALSRGYLPKSRPEDAPASRETVYFYLRYQLLKDLLEQLILMNYYRDVSPAIGQGIVIALTSLPDLRWRPDDVLAWAVAQDARSP